MIKRWLKNMMTGFARLFNRYLLSKKTIAIHTRKLMGACLVAMLLSSVQRSAAAEYANNERTISQLPHQTQAAVIDGDLSDAVWQFATKTTLDHENQPGEGTPAIVKTEVWLYENGERLFVAFKAYDPEPSAIRASYRDRDKIFADDTVGIILDTFNDNRTGYEFFVNPLGAQADMRLSDINGWDEDSSWDAIWDSAGQITAEGYVVELSIPFNVLRFPQTAGEPLTWNIGFWRNYNRDVRRHMSNVALDRNLQCTICQFNQYVGFTDIKTGNNLQLTPTLTLSRRDEKPDVPGPWQNGDVSTDPGLDIRWGVTQDMVLNATINPDFSQVEADASQLDINNTFSLFFPEKRPFFLDGASYFSTENYNLVHTRNIADPDYGMKLTGKTDQHAYGLLIANDQQTTFLLPGNQGSSLVELDRKSTIAIARYKMDVGERNSVGVLLTHRQADEYKNTVASVDGNYWFNEQNSLNYQIVHSQSDTPLSIVNDSDYEDFNLTPHQTGNALQLNFKHQTRDYALKAGYNSIDEGFRADLGFQSRANIERVVLGGERTWYGDNNDTFTRWGYFGDWDKTFDQQGNVLEEEYELHGNLQGPMQLYSNFGLVHRKRLWDEEYFNENQVSIFAKIIPVGNLELKAFSRFGSQIDFANSRIGEVFAVVPTIIWDANQHIRLEIKHDMTRLNVDNKRLFTAHQTDLRLGYQFNMKSIIKLVVQYTDIQRDQQLYLDEVDAHSKYFASQLIYSYKLNAQSLVFLGYSDGGYQDDNLDKLTRDNRTIFAKFSYAWQL
jgi:hypothetical protein